MSTYERTITVPIQPDAVLQEARQALGHHNFRIVMSSPLMIEAAGPGLNSTKENPILGASWIRLTVSPNGIFAEAELNALHRLQAFVLYFPLGLGVSLALLFAAIFRDWYPPLIAMLTVTPWIFISPTMNQWMERRTCAALDTFLANLVEPYAVTTHETDEI